MSSREPTSQALQAEPPASGLWWGAGFAGVVAALVMLAALHLPLLIVLPVASVLLVCGGFALAAVAFVRRGRSRPAYEVAGALVFLGFAAALIPDSEPALALLDQVGTHGLAALTR